MIYFVTAIDTDAGKSICTGFFAKELMQKGRKVITMKPAQTGCVGMSDDIITHRRIMEMDLLPEDTSGLTCPLIFPFPASPHLSAKLAGSVVDIGLMEESIAQLTKDVDDLVIEGVGGLMVPLTDDLLLIDWVASHQWPVVLVTSARLGSINHTLLALEAMKHRGMKLTGILFNQYPQAPAEIADDTRMVVKQYVARNFNDVFWNEIPIMTLYV